MMKKQLLFIPFLLLFQSSFAQEQLRSIIKKLYKQLPQEKVYLSLDKPNYSNGEIIHFRAFVVMAKTHEMDSLSGLLYVDFIEAQTNILMQHKTFPIVDGKAVGSIDTDTLNGHFIIKAYTHWMRNFNPNLQYHGVVSVGNLLKNKPQNDGVEKENTVFRFFPEGGHLIEGIASRLAYKVENDKGKSMAFEGVIVDEKDSIISMLKNEHWGIGTCGFKPEKNKTYKAKITTLNNNTTYFPLSDIKQKGYSISVDNNKNDRISVTVKTNLLDAEMPEYLSIVAHTRGIVNHATQINVFDKTTKEFRITIPYSKFDKDGITHITLFDDKGVPHCERLIFTENLKKRLNISVKTDKDVYKPHEKVTCALDIMDAEGKPVSADVALSVVNLSQVTPPQYGDDILSYLLLKSDLEGSVQNAAYYFDKDNKDADRNLDLLLLTHGWRRFTWKEILTDAIKTPLFLPESDLQITGKITDKNKPLVSSPIVFMFKNNNEGVQYHLSQTDENGGFKIENIYFTDSTNLYAKVKNESQKIKISVDKLDNYEQRLPSNLVIEETDSFSKVFDKKKSPIDTNSLDKDRQLDEFEVKDSKVIKTDARIFYGKANQIIKVDLKEAGGYKNIIEYLEGRANIRIFESFLGSKVSIRPFRGYSSFTGLGFVPNTNPEPTVMVNGMVVDKQTLRSITTLDVERVEVIKSASTLLGANGANGSINIILREGSKLKYDENTDETTKLPNVKIKGYGLVKEFYAPNYDEKSNASIEQDVRSTLYWNPIVQTNEKGKVEFTFFTDDDLSHFKIQVEGIDLDGRVGVGNKTISPKKQ
jgi:TonB-dependent Receptor Plug Domain